MARLRSARARPARTSGRSLSGPLRHVLRHALPRSHRFGAPIETLRRKWPEIVGPHIAAMCRPVRIAHRGPGSVLHIEAESAAAGILSHIGPVLIERVQAAGIARDVSGLRIRHVGHTPGHPKEQPRTATPPSPAAQEQLKLLALSLKEVKNPRLRNALLALAGAVVAHEPAVGWTRATAKEPNR